MVETLSLYNRILARLPPRALHDSCNGELQREVDDVGARLADVLEAFGRLKEVETAVTQLQQDKGDRRRSASLMALVVETERLQRRLSKEMKIMGRSFASGDAGAAAAAATAAATEEVASRQSPVKKTKAVVVSRSQPTSGSDTESDHEEQSPESLSVQSTGAVTILESAQSCLNLVSDKSLSLKTLTVRGLDTTQSVIHRLAQSNDDDAAAVQVVEAVLSSVVERLTRAKCSDVRRIQKLVDTVAEACSARPSLRSHFFRAQAQLESMLLEAVKDQKGKFHPCVLLAREVDTLSDGEKLERLPEVMAVIQSVFGQDTADPRKSAALVMPAVKLLVGWIRALPSKQLAGTTDLGACKAFCESMLQEAERCLDSDAGKGLARLVRLMKMTVSEASDMASAGVTGAAMATGTGVADSGAKNEAIQSAVELVRTLNMQKSKSAREARLPELVDAIEDALSATPDTSIMNNMSSLMHVMRQLASWVEISPIDWQQQSRYERFCKSATQFSHRISNSSARVGFYRKVDKLLRVVTSKNAASANATVATKTEPPSPPSSTTRAREDAAESASASNAVAEALEQVNMWQDGIFSLQQLDKTIKSIDSVLNEHRSNRAWDARSDARVLECVRKLRVCVQGIKKEDHRKKRLSILDSWGVVPAGGKTTRRGKKSSSSSNGGGKSSKKRKL